jgi:DNA-binding SARP family transcriptional activator
VQFKILGPLEVTNDDGAPVVLSGAKQRTVLIALLSAAGDVVSVDRLVAWLWHWHSPAKASAIIQAHVSRLRRVLEPDREPWAAPGVLLRRSPGYLLRVDPTCVDALRFERLLTDGRAALEREEPHLAAELLSAALAQWRGQALADVALVEAAQDTIARLEALRLSATTMRIEADLMLGRHHALVPELESLRREYPLDEWLGGQLMIALYRCGRQADALTVYEGMRNVLAQELDIEPAPSSQRLQAAILAQHPALDRHPAWWLTGRLLGSAPMRARSGNGDNNTAAPGTSDDGDASPARGNGPTHDGPKRGRPTRSPPRHSPCTGGPECRV